MSETILVVEDEPSLRETLTCNLERDGYAVEAARRHDLGREHRWQRQRVLSYHALPHPNCQSGITC